MLGIETVLEKMKFIQLWRVMFVTFIFQVVVLTVHLSYIRQREERGYFMNTPLEQLENKEEEARFSTTTVSLGEDLDKDGLPDPQVDKSVETDKSITTTLDYTTEISKKIEQINEDDPRLPDQVVKEEDRVVESDVLDRVDTFLAQQMQEHDSDAHDSLQDSENDDKMHMQIGKRSWRGPGQKVHNLLQDHHEHPHPPRAKARVTNETLDYMDKLGHKFRTKTEMLKAKHSTEPGKPPQPLQIYTRKNLLMKLLRVSKDQGVESYSPIINMVMDAMRKESDSSEKRLKEVEKMVASKLAILDVKLQHRMTNDEENDDFQPPAEAGGTTMDFTSAEMTTRSGVQRGERVTKDPGPDIVKPLHTPQASLYGQQNIPDIDLNSLIAYDNDFLSSSRVFHLKCKDRLTGVEYRRYMIKLSNHYVIGYLNPHVDTYSVIAVGLSKRRSLRYLFPLPLTVLANKRVGFGSVVILANTMDSYIRDLGLRHILARLCELGAMIIFLPAKRDNTVMVSQTSRVFAADMVQSIYQELTKIGMDVVRPDDKYLMVCDSDLWPLKRNQFLLPEDKLLTARGHLCCRTINERGLEYKMYPLSSTGMKTHTWINLIHRYGGIPENMPITGNNIVQQFVDRFGQVANITTRRSGISDSWFLDQQFLSVTIQHFMDDNGNDSTLFRTRAKYDITRISKARWPSVSQMTQALVDSSTEAHTPNNMYERKLWNQILPLLERMYGGHSIEYKWCVDYHKEFLEKFPYITFKFFSWAS